MLRIRCRSQLPILKHRSSCSGATWRCSKYFPLPCVLNCSRQQFTVWSKPIPSSRTASKLEVGFSRSELRAAIVNFVLPVALAWGMVAYFDQSKFGSFEHLYTRQAQNFGPIRLTLSLLGPEDGTLEPVLAHGQHNRGTVVYIRRFPQARLRVGVEFLGLGTYESDEFTLDAPNAEITLTCSLPELFPAVGAKDWGKATAIRQALLKHQYLIRVDDVVRLKGFVDHEQPERSMLYYGSNPLDGSIVSRELNGRILNAPGLK